ncbi:TolB family protein [Phocaeicola oris]|uniref:TolB family protein n=1 Tax=Phocaeicola oris TaxID=2896850 RepID=UPI00234F6C3A|nr:hypothetical protein [Phocaeicola oris]MCE2615343.1 hypothetical protein [Phocaeicola oris]
MKKIAYFILSGVFLTACQGNIEVAQTLNEEPFIFPDYKEVTVPSNIAPLNFQLMDMGDTATCLIIKGGSASFQVYGKEGVFDIPQRKWRDMLQQQKGKEVEFTVCKRKDEQWQAYQSFCIQVANEEIDPYLVYRLVPPGYSPWDKMGIYQRNLSTFKETAIYENTLTELNCQNCHSFKTQNPNKMIFHSRAWHGGTILIDNGKIEKLNTKTPETISALVYPSWHPTEDMVAFSVNAIGQTFFMSHANRLEGFDAASDVVVYDTKTHQIFSCDLLKSDSVFETQPTFSSDGKSLYFVSAPAVNPMPERYKELHYNLCRIDFDSKTETFGEKVDTIYNAAHDSLSVFFPRVSPDGKYLAVVRQHYGQWSIWHKDADLCLINLQTGEIDPMTDANSHDAESYHSWSHNSRWLAFSSRRDDGLYTKPYFTYIDKNGKAHKPFLLPQKNPKKYYDNLLFAYNIPELVTDKVQVNERSIADKLRDDPGIHVTYSHHFSGQR